MAKQKSTGPAASQSNDVISPEARRKLRETIAYALVTAIFLEDQCKGPKPAQEKFLNELRRYGVPECMIETIAELFKRPPIPRRGRPTKAPRVIKFGHPRTLRRHKKRLLEMQKLEDGVRSVRENVREITKSIADEVERRRRGQ
jgi:hypothetical protein